MKEDSKNSKYKEIRFFLFTTSVCIFYNIFTIKYFVINKIITWNVYLNLALSFLFEFFLLFDVYRNFFLRNIKQSKIFLLAAEITLLIQWYIIYTQHNPFLLSHFIKVFFFDILIVLFTWGILVWFERKRNKKTIIDRID
ncbi:hypothetical protein Trichorick_01067 [Candidatus Trichorickettsia mobilis]|uniref:Uncharacterized protein n=1 Tax=Candidatus Trichorickettsia mobilis TaxID=1346319 RepID=A0ABZ0UW03_9RICK|nr:hypothetical protein [Candidatus Trichorickettsia mobilis]WPY01163.1 hypothetical protein Trichorick_01067 [Candidatus Trichorickettsia mobilis]